MLEYYNNIIIVAVGAIISGYVRYNDYNHGNGNDNI